MQIVVETSDRLVLEERPWLLGSLLILAILVALALAMGLWSTSGWLTLGFGLAAGLLAVCFVVFVQRVIVILDRPAHALVIRRRSLLGQREQTIALAELTGAEVETSRTSSTDSDGSRSTSITHRPVLVTGAGRIGLTEVYSAGNGAREIADAINRWLVRPEG